MIKSFFSILIIVSYTTVNASFLDIFTSDSNSKILLNFIDSEYERALQSPNLKLLAPMVAAKTLQSLYQGSTVEKCTSVQSDNFIADLKKAKNGNPVQDMIIASEEITKNFCGDLKKYNEYFEKNILLEFNKKYNTNYSIDYLDGGIEWVRKGIKKEDIPKWKEHGFTSNSANIWTVKGIIDINEVLAWKAMGVRSAFEAARLKNKGVKPHPHLYKQNESNINQKNTQPILNTTLVQKNSVHDEQVNIVDTGDEIEPHSLINTNQLNVRSSNGRNDPIIGVLNNYDSIEVFGCTEASYGLDVWCKISFSRPSGTFTGWVNSDYISGTNTTSAPYKVINIPINDTLTIRQGNNTKTKMVGYLPGNAKGVKLQMCALNTENQEWCKINYPNMKGWVMKQYIDLDF